MVADPDPPHTPPTPIKLSPDDSTEDDGVKLTSDGFGAKFDPEDLQPMVHISEFRTPPNKSKTDDNRPPKPSKWVNQSEHPKAEAVRNSK